MVLTTYFSSKQDPQRHHSVSQDSLDYIAPLYHSLVQLGLAGRIFCDHLSDVFIAAHETDRIRFVRCRLGEHSLNDERFFVYREYLAANPGVSSVFMVDANDVVITRNPFESLRENTLYVGRDKCVVVGQSAYMRAKLHTLEVLSGLTIPAPMYSMPHYNAGIIGGRRQVMIDLLDRMIDLFNRCEGEGNVNMAALNYLLYQEYDARVLTSRYLPEAVDPSQDGFSRTRWIVSGYPLNSAYKRYETDSDAIFIHK